MPTDRLAVTRRFLLCSMAGLVIALTSCSTGMDLTQAAGTGASQLGMPGNLTQLTAKLSLKVLPESFAYGSDSGQFKLSTTLQDGAIVVRVTGSGMTDLRAFYGELSYPADELTPVAALAQLTGKAGQTLDIVRMDRRGVVELGTVLEHCDQQPGINGTAVLATVSFARHAFDNAKSTSAASVLPPCMDDSRPALGVNCTTSKIEWEHRLPGDYNQNGHVGLEDLTPLAIHWEEAGTFVQDGNHFVTDSIQAVIDTNVDAQIGLPELTALGAHMGSGYDVQIENFNLYRSLDPAADMPKQTGPHGWDSASTIASFSSVNFNTALGNPAQERLRFSVALPGTESGMAYWVRPEAGGTEGAPSNNAVFDPSIAGQFVLEVEPLTFIFGGSADISLNVIRQQDDIALEVWARNAVGLQAFSLNITFDPARFNPHYDLAQNVYLKRPQLSNCASTGVNAAPGKIYCIDTGDGDYTDIGYDGDIKLLHVTATLEPHTSPFQGSVHDFCGGIPEPPDTFWSPAHIYSIAYDPATQELSWDYYSVGDYDQDGNILLDEVVIIAKHWGATGPFDMRSLEFLIDTAYHQGSSLPMIGVEDQMAIGALYCSFIDGYNVYSATDIAEVPVVDQAFKGDPGVAAIGSVPFSSALGDPMTERLHFTYHVDNPQSGQYLWVQTAYKGAIGAAGYNCYVQVP